MRSAETSATLAADGVDLVDEDDARGIALGLIEQVAHAASADADEHLDKFGAGNAEEWHTRFAGYGPAQQRLACAWRSDEQHTLGNAGAQGGELFGIFQELHDFLKLLLGFFDTGHVLESNRGLVAHEHSRAALAKADGLVIRALGLAHHE